ncbi:MAG: hypothetical protein NC133_01205 [Prevotella sp.]|nr:hypothetical protein [Prevotella sp.]
MCGEDEINEILNNREFTGIGQNFQNDKRKNNFIYLPGTKYLHFFREKSSILYLNPIKNRFICCYDIPNSILVQRSGTGKYWDFMNFKKMMLVAEYAIESELVKFEYLQNVGKITSDIDYEDFLTDPALKCFVKTIYCKQNYIDKSLEKNRQQKGTDADIVRSVELER